LRIGEGLGIAMEIQEGGAGEKIEWELVARSIGQVPKKLFLIEFGCHIKYFYGMKLFMKWETDFPGNYLPVFDFLAHFIDLHSISRMPTLLQQILGRI
jgi:hypothetical protein